MMAILSALLGAFMSAGTVQAASQAVGPLEGVWVAQDMVSGGQQIPSSLLENMRLTFKGEKVTIRTPGKYGEGVEDETCAFTIDGATSPARIDIVHPNGVTDAGIYELNGSVLKMAFSSRRGANRPTDFQSAGSSGVAVITYKKGA
jgi:uncharacterized protein (TIGR03067 family)